MNDFEDNPLVIISSSPEIQNEEEERKRAELAVRGVQAVKNGIFRGFKLDAIEGSDWEDITINPKNADMVMDMLNYRYADRFPDLFEESVRQKGAL